ncbi:MAG: tetratricopeptide repeat protein, partial [Gammaproteobacteria bacterium]
AAIYVNQKNYEKAVKQYERLLEKDKNNMTALFYSGFSYFVLEKYEIAKKYWYLSDDDLLKITRQAVNSSFADDELKQHLLLRLS